MKPEIRTSILLAAGFAFAAMSAWLRYLALCQTPYANGWDSYFYLVQLKSLKETGAMHSPEASLIYPYLQWFYRICGDYVLALKAGIAVLAGALCWLAFSLPAAEGPFWTVFSRKAAAASLFLFSPHLGYFAAQFPKNLLGFMLLIAFIASLPCEKPAVRNTWRWLLPAFLLILNYFGHRLTFALAVLYAGLWWLEHNGSRFPKKILRKALPWLLAVTVAWLAAGSVFPGLFHPVDLGRLKGVFSLYPQFAPWSFVDSFGIGRISPWWLVEIVLFTLVWGWFSAFMAFRLFRKNSDGNFFGNAFALWALCSVLLFPFLEWSLTSLSYRFFLVFVLLTPLLVIRLLEQKTALTGLIFAAVLTGCSFFSWKGYDPDKHDPDYAVFDAITHRAMQRLDGYSPELVIAHNALAEYFTFSSGIDAMPWLPEYEIAPERLWRIAAGIPAQTLRYYSNTQKEVYSLGGAWVLLPEYCWEQAIEAAKKEGDDDFLLQTRLWQNPSRRRPGWLLHRKRKF
ncbi:MAG: hypothetical protein H6565_07375 [Lewinellaceae bacterium]|nr:hypothetical protein [Lewinellaceae bacterium]